MREHSRGQAHPELVGELDRGAVAGTIPRRGVAPRDILRPTGQAEGQAVLGAPGQHARQQRLAAAQPVQHP